MISFKLLHTKKQSYRGCFETFYEKKIKKYTYRSINSSIPFSYAEFRIEFNGKPNKNN